MEKKIIFFVLFNENYIPLYHSIIHILKMLSRKVEGLDPLTPWQPFTRVKKVLRSTEIYFLDR